MMKASNARIYYVSVKGCDTWSGKLPSAREDGADGPFRTIGAAQNAIRELKSSGAPMQPVIVYIRQGTYYLDETLVFTPQDSGTQDATVTYAAYEGEKAVISGGREITGCWRTEDGNIYYTEIPEAENGAWKIRSLFVNGRRAINARYPNYIENDPEGHGFLYVYPDAKRILAGLAKTGDFVEYTFEAVTAGQYCLWMGVATMNTGIERVLDLQLDGSHLSLPAIPPTEDWRSVDYRYVTKVFLEEGKHILRLDNTYKEGEKRVHLDGFIFTDDPKFQPLGAAIPDAVKGEHRITVRAEDDMARTGGFSSIAFEKYHVATEKPDTTTIHMDPARMKASWAKEEDALVNIVVEHHYMNELVKIESMDIENGIIRLKGDECKHFIWPGNYFFISGVKEELDMPGEWYLDSSKGRLYYWPREGEDLNSAEVVAPRLEKIIELNGDDGSEDGGRERVRWIKFQGLTFMHCADTINHTAIRTPTDGAVKLTHAWNNNIENCHFTNVDSFGVWLHLDSCENVISGNTMDYMGAGGILLTSSILAYADPYDLRPGVSNYAPLRNHIIRNHIHNGNHVRFNGAGILLDSRPESTAFETGNLIAFNEIHHMKRQGIFGFQNQGGNIIAYNYFHHLMLETADGGAVNIASMNVATAPTLVKNNLIHDVVGLKREGEGKPGYFGGAGIYPDWSTSHFIVENNVVYNTGFSAYLTNAGQFNRITNNIFCDDARTLLDFELNYAEVRDNHFYCNIFANTRKGLKNLYLGAWGMSEGRRNHLLEVISDNPGEFLQSDLNLYWNAGQPICIQPFSSIEKWQDKCMDNNSIVADPLFEDAEKGNYSLKPESPVFRLGFKPFDITNNGLNAQADKEIDLSQVTVKYVEAGIEEAVRNDKNSLVFIPSIPASGRYRVYVKLSEREDFGVAIHHAKGVTAFNMNDWMCPEVPPEWSFCIGTYEFLSGTENNVIITDAGGFEGAVPVRVSFVQAYQPDNGIVE